MLLKKDRLTSPLILTDQRGQELEMTIKPFFRLVWKIKANASKASIFYISRSDEVYYLFFFFYQDLKEGLIYLPYEDSEKEWKRVSLANQKEKELGIRMNVIRENCVHFISESPNNSDWLTLTENQNGIYIIINGPHNKPFYEVEFKGDYSKYNNLNTPLFRLYTSLNSYTYGLEKTLERKKENG